LGSARDRIFVCCGPEVRGFTKKGKQFFGFDTNLTESIQTMHISGSDLFLCGTYIYNHYQDCKDIDYYLSPDRINDVLYLNTERSPDPLPILACQDRMLRILRNSELLYECELVGPPRYLMLNNRDGGDQGDEVVYGTADGKVGLVRLTQSTPEYKWEAGAGAHHGDVQCIDMYDLTRDGVPEILVGHGDGSVEVYVSNEVGEPQIQFKQVSGSCLIVLMCCDRRK
jgi:Bardet-Biedl syndrome 7 protein